jgi:hypothetical protein
LWLLLEDLGVQNRNLDMNGEAIDCCHNLDKQRVECCLARDVSVAFVSVLEMFVVLGASFCTFFKNDSIEPYQTVRLNAEL